MPPREKELREVHRATSFDVTNSDDMAPSDASFGNEDDGLSSEDITPDDLPGGEENVQTEGTTALEEESEGETDSQEEEEAEESEAQEGLNTPKIPTSIKTTRLSSAGGPRVTLSSCIRELAVQYLVFEEARANGDSTTMNLARGNAKKLAHRIVESSMPHGR
jgi:hypothetical protein